MQRLQPGSRGRLLLWHGLPGCGKTWALRALASEWQEWCKLRYVSDPERLLKESSYLTEIIHMRPGGQGRDDRWWLIVLEDTGELLADDAKSKPVRGSRACSTSPMGCSAKARRRSFC